MNFFKYKDQSIEALNKEIIELNMQLKLNLEESDKLKEELNNLKEEFLLSKQNANNNEELHAECVNKSIYLDLNDKFEKLEKIATSKETLNKNENDESCFETKQETLLVDEIIKEVNNEHEEKEDDQNKLENSSIKDDASCSGIRLNFNKLI
jgi:hypothetical protein